MSEGTTKPNGGREMKIIEDDNGVKERIEKYGIEFTGVTIQVSDKKIRNDEIAGNGDKINKPGDFILAASANSKELIAQEILEGNKAKAGKQVGHKKVDKKPKQKEDANKSKEDKSKPNTHTER